MSELRDGDLLLNRFYEHCKNRPDDVYLTQPIAGDDHVVEYTFSQVLDQAKRMAAYLNSLGLEPESKIAMISKNCAHFFMADLAIWMSGNVSVALYPTLNRDTVEYILGHSDAKLLYVGKLDTWEEVKHGVPAGLAQISLPLAPKAVDVDKWDDIVAKHEPLDDNPTRPADGQSLIIYTSGSTGRPKGVVHSFRTISAPTLGLIASLDVTQEDRLLSYLPSAHAMDRWLSECLSLATGAKVFFAESLKTFVHDLKRARPTLFVSVPRLWLKFQLGVFAKMPPGRLNFLLMIPIVSGIVKKKLLTQLGLDSVRFAGSGSAPIPADLIQWYRNLGLELLEGYGMSENFNYSHITVPGKGRPGYIGNPYDDVDCRLSDVGEIQIKSPGNMVEYYKDPEQTKDAFTDDGYLKTGDRGDVDEEGRLRIIGRVKEIFKTSKGKYVAPAPIENKININPNVELSVVSGSGQVATYAVLQLGEDLVPKLGDAGVKDRVHAELEALLDKVNGEIEHFEKMQFLVVAKDQWSIESGQLTPTMKIKRTPIEAMYEAKLEPWYASGDKVIWE